MTDREWIARFAAALETEPPGAPAFDQSAMDGWAVRAAETPGRLRVAGESAAGAPPPPPLPRGAAARISTGAPLPRGADAVVRAEEGREDGALRVAAAVAPGRDV